MPDVSMKIGFQTATWVEHNGLNLLQDGAVVLKNRWTVDRGLGIGMPGQKGLEEE